eukprot:TRINITY_DN10256_c0_g1_i1.p1 TRINITY_DN10256_c0_g1~~TRINITY_DN10256_c0_g1_i1.p1  ORF type:complete len:441 (+),score=58.30 TRINITY_DN10256_c0_g1_i1:135-1457(+)
MEQVGSEALDRLSAVSADVHAQQKQKRKRGINTYCKACVFCQKSHASCDAGRPCQRCVSKGVPELCVDGASKKRGRKSLTIDKVKAEVAKVQPEQVHFQMPIPQSPSQRVPLPLAMGTFVPALLPNDTILVKNNLVADDLADFNMSALEEFMFAPMDSLPLAFEPFFTTNIPCGNLDCHVPQSSPASDMSGSSEGESGDASHHDINKTEELNSKEEAFKNNKHLKHYFEPGKAVETPSTIYRPEWNADAVEFLRTRLNEDQIAEYIKMKREYLQPLLMKIRSTMTKEVSLSIFAEFEELLKTFCSAFDKLSTPVIIFEKSGIAQYVNNAYRKMTGFSYPTLPTKRTDFVLYQQTSSSSLWVMLRAIISASADISTNVCVIPLQWLCYGKYVDVIAMCTIKRDSHGLLMMVVVTLAPVVQTPLKEAELPTAIRQLGRAPRM